MPNLALSDSVILTSLITQYGYKDKKSFEPSTGRIKTKYKLAGNIVATLGIYTFFVMTSQKQACESVVTLEINENDWEQRSGIQGTGYLDIKKIEALNKDELLIKKRDSQNGFQCVGRLCDVKYNELKSLSAKTHMTRVPLTIEKQSLIKQALDDAGISTDIIQRLGLA